ncbi:hypothetical protein C8J57DRAFT_1219944 [Mycena rebaudengoi]|nr:hypothetical protein C8J57DRAFT_1219944 [Mycena rebaudengoi]
MFNITAEKNRQYQVDILKIKRTNGKPVQTQCTRRARRILRHDGYETTPFQLNPTNRSAPAEQGELTDQIQTRDFRVFHAKNRGVVRIHITEGVDYTDTSKYGNQQPLNRESALKWAEAMVDQGPARVERHGRERRVQRGPSICREAITQEKRHLVSDEGELDARSKLDVKPKQVPDI